jgi:hypothetical protein
MARRIKLLVPIVVIAVGLCVLRDSTRAGGAAADKPAEVSMIQLIANPDAFHGKMVRVRGIVSIVPWNTAIYLHTEDYDRPTTKNGLWLAGLDYKNAEIQSSEDNGRFLLIEGRFNAKDKGYDGKWSGSIEKYQRVDPPKPSIVDKKE